MFLAKYPLHIPTPSSIYGGDSHETTMFVPFHPWFIPWNDHFFSAGCSSCFTIFLKTIFHSCKVLWLLKHAIACANEIKWANVHKCSPCCMFFFLGNPMVKARQSTTRLWDCQLQLADFLLAPTSVELAARKDRWNFLIVICWDVYRIL